MVSSIALRFSDRVILREIDGGQMGNLKSDGRFRADLGKVSRNYNTQYCTCIHLAIKTRWCPLSIKRAGPHQEQPRTHRGLGPSHQDHIPPSVR
ncbi:uncharacterized protein LAJ45_02910 [Morchella importuna]|uniref:uncharacterized protein n=1 Tax=Morchella importuna TaxID=1174673 RepID=UPI001E8D5584|nr:uncharacterized protein LAJ45_02910 [Morchella importuna]KAH8153323.1 hypothetical protein LAJ45_02910 [Morchella importuna]